MEEYSLLGSILGFPTHGNSHVFNIYFNVHKEPTQRSLATGIRPSPQEAPKSPQ